MTGNTLGKTTDPSAKYWYKTRVSPSSDEYLTKVARTVNTRAWMDKSGRTSGSSRTFDSFDTEEREPRSCSNIYLQVLVKLPQKVQSNYTQMV